MKRCFSARGAKRGVLVSAIFLACWAAWITGYLQGLQSGVAHGAPLQMQPVSAAART